MLYIYTKAIQPKISVPPIAIPRLRWILLKNKKLNNITNNGYEISMSDATVAFFDLMATSIRALAKRKRVIATIKKSSVFFSCRYFLKLKSYFPKYIIQVRKTRLNIAEKKQIATIGILVKSFSMIEYCTPRATATMRA